MATLRAQLAEQRDLLLDMEQPREGGRDTMVRGGVSEIELRGPGGGGDRPVPTAGLTVRPITIGLDRSRANVVRTAESACSPAFYGCTH